MGDIRAIETYYKGYRFRSRLEARWAVFFDLVGIEFEYEPEGLILRDGTKYLPDFYLPQFYCYFEVKRKGIEEDKAIEAIAKISDGHYTGKWAGIICFGDPYDHDMRVYCQESDDDGGGPYTAKVVFARSVITQKPILFSWNDTRARSFYPSWEESERKIIPMETDVDMHTVFYASNPYITEDIIFAELAARQARFEYGETPIPVRR